MTAEHSAVTQHPSSKENSGSWDTRKIFLQSLLQTLMVAHIFHQHGGVTNHPRTSGGHSSHAFLSESLQGASDQIITTPPKWTRLRSSSSIFWPHAHGQGCTEWVTQSPQRGSAGTVICPGADLGSPPHTSVPHINSSEQPIM